MSDYAINLGYIAAAILFILGIKRLGNVNTARRGNRLSAVGMLLAVTITLFDRQIVSFPVILGGLAVGGLIGAVIARNVRMTAIPEMVALFNGFGGLASLLVAVAEVEKYRFAATSEPLAGVGLPGFVAAAAAFAVLIGGTTFTGSLVAFGKLAGKLSGRPLLFRGQNTLNGMLVVVVAASLIAFAWGDSIGSGYGWLLAAIGLTLVFGVLAVIPIGGGDMPVVIALLNSLSGLAAAATGFVILNNVLIVAGCLVGASGFILTVIMCKAMNRNLFNVVFDGFGKDVKSGAGVGETGELKPITAENAWYLLEAANRVVFVPGYGMAVAQAQHSVKELSSLLEENGCEVQFAIHPVAGRMPGHMNVLLAEADVPYEKLFEMEHVNPVMDQVAVAIVIGANDVVNPAAMDDPSSPIFGMPIIEAHRANVVLVLKRGQGAGFSGIVNRLFTLPNSRMLYGDAKDSITALVNRFKES